MRSCLLNITSTFSPLLLRKQDLNILVAIPLLLEEGTCFLVKKTQTHLSAPAIIEGQDGSSLLHALFTIALTMVVDGNLEPLLVYLWPPWPLGGREASAL